MIIRVLGEGQFEVDADRIADLNELDAKVEQAVADDDATALQAALHRLVAEVREYGSRLADEVIQSSDLVLPPVDATVGEVRDMLADDGLLPG